MYPEFNYTNPVITDPALSLRDPFILKDGDTWWLTGTSAPAWGGPNPGVRLLASRDLLNWTHHSWLIDATTLPPGCPYNGRFWAPELHAAHNRFYLTVNSGREGPRHGDRRLDDHRVFIFVADAVTGPYVLLTPSGLGAGFKNDANLFTDTDGRSYLYASGGGLWQAEINLTSGRLLTPDGDFQKILSPRDPGLPDWMIGGVEGPCVIHRHDAYWMLFSAWTRGYEVGVLRAPTPLGPWKLAPREPLFGTRKRHYRERQMIAGGYAHVTFTDTPDPFVEVGHCAVFTGPDGGDWLCSHYLPEGKIIAQTEPVLEYADTLPQLGYEPLRFSRSLFVVNGPTWTPQSLPA